MTDTNRPAALPGLSDGFNSFPTVTHSQWRALAELALKGGDFEKRLVSKSLDGLAIQPVYRRDGDDQPLATTRDGRPWGVVCAVDHPEPAAARTLALADLTGGADTLALVFDNASRARGFGLSATSLETLENALLDVDLEIISLRLEPSTLGRFNAALVAALVQKRGLVPSNLSISWGLDPFGPFAHLGVLPTDMDAVSAELAADVASLSELGFTGPFVIADARVINDAGGSEVEELAYALAAGAYFLRAFEAGGLSLAAADRAIEFAVAIDTDQFMGTAKLRALRQLWAHVQAACRIDQAPVRIHAETAWRHLTYADVAVNMLRNTIATFTAGIAGADSVAVTPHTAVHGLPNADARRVARNTQMVLLEESNLWRVRDPAAGSGALSTLTRQLSEAAWQRFQEIETEGGLLAALRAGTLQQRVASTRAKQLDQVAALKQPLTGTSTFPQLDQGPVRTLDIPRDTKRGRLATRNGKPSAALGELVTAFVDGGDRTTITPSPPALDTVAALPGTRLAEPFEDIRARTDAAGKRGLRPTIFLAILGPAGDHAARATWTTSLLASGGIDVLRPAEGFTASGPIGLAFAESQLSVACLCGDDASYAEIGDAAAQALKSAGAQHVILAGKPGALEAGLRAAGVDQFVFAGQNALQTLMKLQEALDV